MKGTVAGKVPGTRYPGGTRYLVEPERAENKKREGESKTSRRSGSTEKPGTAEREAKEPERSPDARTIRRMNGAKLPRLRAPCRRPDRAGVSPPTPRIARPWGGPPQEPAPGRRREPDGDGRRAPTRRQLRSWAKGSGNAAADGAHGCASRPEKGHARKRGITEALNEGKRTGKEKGLRSSRRRGSSRASTAPVPATWRSCARASRQPRRARSLPAPSAWSCAGARPSSGRAA